MVITRRNVLIAIIVLVLGGVAFGVYLLTASRSSDVGQSVNSPDGTARAFIAEVTSNNTDVAYERLSNQLKEDYSADYWKRDFFTKFVGYREQPQLLESTELTKAGSEQALGYPPETSVWHFAYQFRLNNLNYQLTIETSKSNDSDNWNISKLEGRYIKE